MFTVAVVAMLGLLVRDRGRQARTGTEGLLGVTGTAVTKVGANGKVKVSGELWNARSRQEITEGRKVRVEAVVGLELEVKEERE
jgi:membrane-bound serine protease (ClpP class)